MNDVPNLHEKLELREGDIFNRSFLTEDVARLTEYYADGAQGKLEGQFEWAKQDGNWYPKHGKQLLSSKPYAEWDIEEISFDANKVRTQFNDLEKSIPFATRIFVIDEQGNTVSTTFSGGKEGEAEHNLRQLAWLKRKKEGF